MALLLPCDGGPRPTAAAGLLLLGLALLLQCSAAFDVVWSGLFPCCGGTTAFNLTAFPVLQQKRLMIFDGSLGLFNESVPPQMPQTVDLVLHAAKVAHDVARCTYATCIPPDKDMYCVIDWEAYTPVIFDHGAPGGCPGPYTVHRYSMPGATCAACNSVLNASIARVLQRQPALKAAAAAAVAVAEFNGAARALWTKTLEVAKQTRPQCNWGFYGKPLSGSINPPFMDGKARAINDEFQWIYDASTALFPSTYLHYNGSAAHNNSAFVQTVVSEAQRVNYKRTNASGAPATKMAKILPWIWYRYDRLGSAEHASLVSPLDMYTALAAPGIAGADGVLLYEDGKSWGNSPAQKAEKAMVQAYVDTVVGPTAAALYGMNYYFGQNKPNDNPVKLKTDDTRAPGGPVSLELWVDAATGDDRAAGSKASPLRSLPAAAARMRHLKQSSAATSVVHVDATGTYSPLHLTKVDSNTAWRCHGGGCSGTGKFCEVSAGSRPGNSSAHWSVSLDERLPEASRGSVLEIVLDTALLTPSDTTHAGPGGQMPTDQHTSLFFNGHEMQLARYPNVGLAAFQSGPATNWSIIPSAGTGECSRLFKLGVGTKARNGM